MAEASYKLILRERVINTFRLFGDGFYILSGLLASQTLMEAVGRSLGGGIAFSITLIVMISSFMQARKTLAEAKNIQAIEFSAEEFQAMSFVKVIYIRLLQALRPRAHGRNTIGLSMQVVGGLFISSGVASTRYFEMLLGGLIFIAGSILTYTIDDFKAWNRFGIFSLCTLTPAAIPNAIEASYQDDYLIAGATISHFSASLIAAQDYIKKIIGLK